MNPFAHFEDQFGHLKLSDNDAALHVFLAGWNSAMMEMMQRVNKMPFGDDTRASFAVYFQSQMVNVDAIEKPAQQDPDRVKFERHWRKTRGEKKANRELPRHPLQPQTYIQDSANRHWVTWQAAVMSVAPPAQRKPLTHEQRVDLLAKFEAHKHEWHAPTILIDMVEAAHGIKGDA